MWVAINDPKSVSWYRPERVTGPVGQTQWKEASWDFEGHRTIICAVTANGSTQNYTYEQYVASLASVIATGPRLPLSKDDPDMVLDGTARMVYILEQLAALTPPATAELANKPTTTSPASSTTATSSRRGCTPRREPNSSSFKPNTSKARRRGARSSGCSRQRWGTAGTERTGGLTRATLGDLVSDALDEAASARPPRKSNT